MCKAPAAAAGVYLTTKHCALVGAATRTGSEEVGEGEGEGEGEVTLVLTRRGLFDVEGSCEWDTSTAFAAHLELGCVETLCYGMVCCWCSCRE